MHLQKFSRSCRWLASFAVVLLIASCGAGGSCNANSFAFGSVAGESCKDNKSPISTSISGVAAGGSPIIGNVEITDKFGVKKGSPINDDGTYKIDVNGMTGPFIVKAFGTIAGVNVSYWSAGTQADVGGNINVTPFTDLLLSAIAGRLVNSYLSDESNIAKLAAGLTDDKIRSAQDALFATLRPVLIKLGVTQSIDLIRTLFKADHSGLDALMDLVKVEYDPDKLVAVLRSRITQDKLVELDLTKPIPGKPIPPENSQGIDTSSASDVQAIGKVLVDVEALFARGLPTVDELTNSGLFDSTDTFMNGGESYAQFAASLTSDPATVGFSLRNWSLSQLTPGEKATIYVRLGIKSQSEFVPEKLLLVLTKSSGKWRISGDQRIAEINIYNEQMLMLNVNNQLANTGSPRIYNGIRFDIVPFAYNNSGKNTPRITKAEVTGQGITNPLQLEYPKIYPDTWMNIFPWPILSDGNGFWDCASALASETSWPCLNLPAVNTSANYKVILKDSGGQSLNGSGYSVPLGPVPMKFSSLSQNMFVRVSSVTIGGAPLTASAFRPNNNMRVQFELPANLQIGSVQMIAWGKKPDGSLGTYIREEYSVPLGTTVGTFGWGSTLDNTTVDRVHLRITALNQSGHKFVTEIDITVPAN
jgi:hypothetical protein